MFWACLAAVFVCYGLIQVANAIMALANHGISVYHRLNGTVNVEKEQMIHDSNGWKITVRHDR